MLKIKMMLDKETLGLTWYFLLYNLAADECANNILWTAMYGSDVESPLVQFAIPKGEEQRLGGINPVS